MARHKDLDWNLYDTPLGWEQVQVAVLMDLRDELKRLNRLLYCSNFVGIPHALTAIRKNTTKPRKKKGARRGK